MITLELFEKSYADRHLLYGVIEKWAKEKPETEALICANDDRHFTWKKVKQSIDALAYKLVQMGFKKGDYFATSLPFSPEHIFLQYACFSIGIIFVPLDIRLKGPEVIRSLGLVQAKAFAHLGKLEIADFSELGKAVQANCPFVEIFLQFSHIDECNKRTLSAFDFAKEAEKLFVEIQNGQHHEISEKYMVMKNAVKETDGCLVIYTTGSTGFPKPALLSHRGITAQNLCLSAGFDMNASDLMLVNLPPSHVGGQTEQLMSNWFVGGKVVTLNLFDETLSMEAIQKYKVTVLGQIPALFNYEWDLPNFKTYDVSSLKFALYGGQAVSREFLEKLAKMSPRFGSGLGLTETSGFCTYTPLNGTVDDILAGIGYAMPITPISIREPMQPSGLAGIEKKQGEIGEICFSGPQIFIGYVNDPANTAKAVSTDGFCYTGDLGFYDEKGLHFSGRSKLVIKPKGYQVYPGEIENFIADALKDKVENVAAVGVKHEKFTEAVFVFVEKKKDVTLTIDEINVVTKGMAAYKRPSWIEILDYGELPLNRVNKTDYVRLKKQADMKVDVLRKQGAWDK